jgi:drug/metabolite transporter (DMT)-like permease
MITTAQETLIVSTAAVTLAVTTFYNIRRKRGTARWWYVAGMILGGVLGVAITWNNDVDHALAFTIGLGAHQLSVPLQRLIDKYVSKDKDDDKNV